MSDQLTLARPYAKACYEFAVEKHQLDAWHKMLLAMTEVMSNEQMQSVLALPEVESSVIEAIVLGVLNSALDDSAKNFLKLLISNKRLLILPEILCLFEKIKAEAESTINVSVTTAVQVTSDAQAKLIKQISDQLSKKVSAEFHTDPTLIAGAVVRLGEMNVIDGSLKTQLLRMKEKFKAI